MRAKAQCGPSLALGGGRAAGCLDTLTCSPVSSLVLSERFRTICCPAEELVLSGLPWNATTDDVLAFLSPVVPEGGTEGLFMTYNSA